MNEKSFITPQLTDGPENLQIRQRDKIRKVVRKNLTKKSVR